MYLNYIQDRKAPRNSFEKDVIGITPIDDSQIDNFNNSNSK